MRVPYSVISGDSHLEVLPHRWRDWVADTYRERLPDAIRLSDPAREGTGREEA